jgi:hypothetical protein
MRKARSIWAAVALLAAASISVGAQVTSGEIAGKVTDAKGQPLAGAVVRAEGPCLQGAHETSTDPRGYFDLLQLPPCEQVTLTVAAPGLAAVVRKDLTVKSNTVTTVSVAVGVGDELTVAPPAPMVSTRQAETPLVLPAQEMEALPVLGEFQDRSYQSLLYITPSSSHSRRAGNPAVGGATGVENIYLIDGIKTNDPVNGEWGTNMNYAFFQSLDSTVYGSEAQSATSTGGYFNMVTQSGSDEWHGSVFGWFTTSGMTARVNSNDFEVTEDQDWRAQDYGFTLSGPIVKDRLWFFVGANPYHRSDDNRGYDIVENQKTSATIGLPYDYSNVTNTTTYIAKLTWRISQDHRLELETFGDPSRQDLHEGPTPTLFPQTLETRRDVGSSNIGLKWYATWAPRFFTDAHIAFTRRHVDLVPTGTSMSTPLLQSQDWNQNLAVSPGFGKFSYDDRDTDQLGFKATWLPAGSEHEISFGGDLENSDWTQTADYTGGYLERLKGKEPGEPITAPSSYKNWYVTYLQNPKLNVTGSYGSLYLQDRWTISDRVTLTAGLRWEQNRVESQYGNSLTLQDWSPRLGLSWDVLGNGKSKLYATAGRYAERVPLYIGKVMDTGHASYKDTYVWGVLTSHTAFNPAPAFALGGVKNQSQDEYVLGFQWEPAAAWCLTARAVYRDLNRLLETTSYINPATGAVDYIIMNPGYQWSPLQDTWSGQVPDFARFPKPVRRYQALELAAEKRFANHWFLQGSYTLSSLRGNTAAGYDRTGKEVAPNATTEWDIPSARWSQNRYGYLPTDRTHMAKVVGGYRWDNGLLLGGSMRFDTGRPINRLADWPQNDPGYGTIFVTPRGQAGRLASALSINLHLEFAIKIGKSSLTLFADVLNLLNDQVEFTVDETYYQTKAHWSDPSVPNSSWGKTTKRTEPRAGAVGFKWSF